MAQFREFFLHRIFFFGTRGTYHDDQRRWSAETLAVEQNIREKSVTFA